MRGIGKTTTMLQQALSAALGGSTVFVVAVDHPHRQELMRKLQALPEVPHFAVFHYTNTEVALWPRGQILFRTIKDPSWDQARRQMRGYPGGTPTLLDHHTEEWLEMERLKKLKDARASSSTKAKPSSSEGSDGNSTEPSSK